jgi:hypothetical protein
MENIDIKELKKLLVIIKDAPNIRVGHFSSCGIGVAKLLESFCREKEYEYVLYTITKEYQEIVANVISSAKYFNLARPKYMLNGKFFDYLFVTADINDKESFIKKAHGVIKNAGEIIIFIETNDYANRDLWYRLLEENYYVATSCIEVDSNYSVIVSKKMHGWGG